MNLQSLHALLVLIFFGHNAESIANTGASSMKVNRTASSMMGLTKEMTYSQNSLCRQNYCINPLFPGLNDLPRLEKLDWQCAEHSMVTDYLDFCGGAINYNPALPSPVSKATPIDQLVKAQDDAAMTMFFYHLSGMGYDAWDYQEPKNTDNSCVRTVWKMVCYTYFPRSAAGCKVGEPSGYKRPCASCCQNYIQQCGIECCDESVSCVFAHTAYDEKGKLQLLQTGYVDALGPSASCTGSARRMVSSPFMLLMVLFGIHVAAASSSQQQGDGQKTRAASQLKYAGLGASGWAFLVICALLAVSLQGCDLTIPKHTVGNWRTKDDYLMQFKYVPPGKPLSKAVLNSCSIDDLPPAEQCSGKGFCRSFSTSSVHAQKLKPLAFCQCDRNYADPECSTKRKSQTIAFLWSLFLGMFGADYFYLGFPLWGVGKLLTLGGFGFWWIVDIVRTGAGPVYAYNFRTADDLPHWAAVLTMVSVCMCCGFFVAIEGYLTYRRQKRYDLAALSNKEEERHLKHTEEQIDEMDGPRYRVHGPQTFGNRMGFSGYGAMLPMMHPNAAGPRAEFQGKQAQYPFAGPHGPYAGGTFNATGEPVKTQSEYPNYGVRHGLM